MRHTTCLALLTLNKQKAPVVHHATHRSHLESGGERELRGKEVRLMSKLLDYLWVVHCEVHNLLLPFLLTMLQLSYVGYKKKKQRFTVTPH